MHWMCSRPRSRRMNLFTLADLSLGFNEKLEKCHQILLVGISYNRNKCYTCKIEKQERKRCGIEGSAAR